MPHETKPRPMVLRLLPVLFCGAAFALSACTPTTPENTMTGSSNPSDPATVKAQVQELKQALADLHSFKTETQKVTGPQNWTVKSLRNMSCSTPDGKDGVNYSVLSQTMEPLDLEASMKLVKASWESKGFTTQTEPREPGLIDLNAAGNDGHLASFTANIKGSSLEMNSICIAGDQTAIYRELYPEIYGLPSSSDPSPTTK